MNESADKFTPRHYQLTLVEKATKANSIIYLPTGSGKTYIALMLIKHFSKVLEKSLEDGGKRSVFLVNTVPLVAQQAQTIRYHTHIDKVGEYTGAKNVDNWTNEQWNNELSQNQVLVMTCQIFLDILRHGYITFKFINIIILDECHHAVRDHPMHQLMQVYVSSSNSLETRVLGLTGSLLNGNCHPANVMAEVRALEGALNSKVITVETLSEVIGYSTNPEEITMIYKEPAPSHQAAFVNNYIEKAITTIKDFACEDLQNIKFPESSLKKASLTIRKSLQNLLQDTQLQLQMLGLYGGSIATLAPIQEIETLKKKCSSGAGKMLCVYGLSILTVARKYIEFEMNKHSESEQIYKFSTEKVKALFAILESYSPANNATPLKGIIFVERRFTAKILCHIIKFLSQCSPKFAFLNPNFMVGLTSKVVGTRTHEEEAAKRMKDVVMEFKSGKSNLLIASNVVEEGLDVPKCSLVVRFDQVTTYCTYIQSKGRARNKNSKFYVLVNNINQEKFMKKYDQFGEIENVLRNFLVGETENRKNPSKEEIECQLEEKVDPYFTCINARVTMVSSISLINRYCSMLPHDRFTTLTVNYYEESQTFEGKQKYRVLLELPIVSSIKDRIIGEWMTNKRDAKRIVALRACEILHKAGELDDHLMPIQCSLKAQNTALIDGFQDHWDQNDCKVDEFGHALSNTGTKKRKRLHKRKVPESLLQTSPIANQYVYVHLIHTSTEYTEQTNNRNRLLMFFEMINNEQTYAIISAKPLPDLCDFPLFFGMGEIKISIKNNYRKIILRDDEIDALRLFHIMLFRDVLCILKDFLILDKSNEGVGYLIAPINKDLNIDWDVVRKFPELKLRPIQALSERQKYTVNPADYQSEIVIPCYRAIGNGMAYIVSKVCSDMSPDTAFPTDKFQSYRQYFYDKYRLYAHSNQPLLEAQLISFSKLNHLKPRNLKTNKNKPIKDNDMAFDEYLIPEFCIRVGFPAALYVKAAAIPSVIHRLTSLMRAHEIILRISKEIGLESTLPSGSDIMPLKYSKDCESTNIYESENKNDLQIINNNNNIDIINLRFSKINLSEIWSSYKSLAKEKHLSLYEGRINILQTEPGFIQVCEMLSVLTATSANDICNLERLETLGDSFLKVAVTVYLMMKYPSLDEGQLTMMKCQIIGNKNLYYCAAAKEISGQINTSEFLPYEDWIPPSFKLPEIITEYILKDKISAEFLHKIFLPKDEVMKGVLNEKTIKNVIKILEKQSPDNFPMGYSLNKYLGFQFCNDKTSADCIEALIGLVLKSCGITSALKLLGWLNVVPASEELNNLWNSTPPSAIRHPNTSSEDIDFHLVGLQKLESILQYNFRDRSYLLQALTHASYTSNRLTDCYQRLEFLGDSILDFLITCYIYENCGELSPGEMTDLRSALVNNITFASLTVRYGFHKFLLSFNPALQEAIYKFVYFQDIRKHAIDEEVLYLLEERECSIAEYIDVPKVLGDLFESIAGAVFLDSGMNLEIVWDVFYKLMKGEIKSFSKDVPKQVVRVLYEANCLPKFGDVIIDNSNVVIMPLTFSHLGNVKKVYGLGMNKNQAMKAAAKIALRVMQM